MHNLCDDFPRVKKTVHFPVDKSKHCGTITGVLSAEILPVNTFQNSGSFKQALISGESAKKKNHCFEVCEEANCRQRWPMFIISTHLITVVRGTAEFC